MIPVSKPIIAKNAKKYILECLKSGWVSSKGPMVEKFDKFLQIKNHLAETYAKELTPLRELQFPIQKPYSKRIFGIMIY